MSETPYNASFGKVVARGVAVSSLGNIGLRVLDFLIAIVMLRWLSVFEFGVYQLALSAYDFCVGFLLPGVDNVVVSDASAALSERPREAKALFSVYMYLLCVLSVMLWALFFWGGAFFGYWFSVDVAYLRIVSFLFLLFPLDTMYRLKFQIFLDFGWSTFFKIARNCFRIISIFIFFGLFFFNLYFAFWSLFVSIAGPIAVAFIFYRRHSLFIFPSYDEAVHALGALLTRHGKWAMFEDIVGNVGKNIRPFIIKVFAGVEAVALFSVAQSLLGYVTSIFPLRDVLTPVFPRVTSDRVALARQINRASKYATYAYILLALGAAVGAPLLIFIFFPKYIAALPLFYILLVGLPWLGFRSVALPVFYALQKQETLFVLTIARTLLVSFLGVTLTYVFGVWGAALEACLVGIILTPTFGYALRVILPEWRLSWREILLFDDDDRDIVRQIKNRFLRKAA